jgi:hypothetical protein
MWFFIDFGLAFHGAIRGVPLVCRAGTTAGGIATNVAIARQLFATIGRMFTAPT